MAVHLNPHVLVGIGKRLKTQLGLFGSAKDEFEINFENFLNK